MLSESGERNVAVKGGPRVKGGTVKRIAIFCDGTWNRADQEHDGVPCPTNVVKLALRIMPQADGVRQVTYYAQGVGTGNWLDRFSGGAFGDGLTDNLFAAYRFLMLNYEPGDALYFFGFSRGAFTARSLVGMIKKCGILKRASAMKYRDAVELYRDESHPTHVAPTKFRTNHCVVGNEPIPIEFVGVWDTVGALGIPLRGLRFLTAHKHKFHDVELSGTVRNAYHALAIEERRGPFDAARWAYVPKAGQTVKQVWFAGVHSDVGGGYSPHSPRDGWGLSDVSLVWMSERAQSAGLVLGEPAFPVNPNPFADKHESRRGLYWFTRPQPRIIGMAATPEAQPTAATTQEDPTQSLHPSVYERWDARADFRPENLRAYFKRTGDPRGFERS